MSDREFFTGPPLLSFFDAEVVTGSGETKLQEISIKYGPNQINRSFLDIASPNQFRTSIGPARLSASDLATCSNVYIARAEKAILIKASSGSLGSVQIPSDSHLLWLIFRDSVSNPEEINKGKLFGGQKTVGCRFTVHSKERDLTRSLEVTFLNEREARATCAWARDGSLI